MIALAVLPTVYEQRERPAELRLLALELTLQYCSASSPSHCSSGRCCTLAVTFFHRRGSLREYIKLLYWIQVSMLVIKLLIVYCDQVAVLSSSSFTVIKLLLSSSYYTENQVDDSEEG